MGTSQSSAQPSPEEVAKRRERSRHVMAFKRLYGELNAPDHQGRPATIDIFKVERGYKRAGRMVYLLRLTMSDSEAAYWVATSPYTTSG